MAQEHYNAVRESDLYEYGGTRKVLLTYIAGLIIGPREENAQGKPVGEPDKDEGWCVARQEILAAWVGCSPEEACRQIDEFVQDGWLTKEKFTDSYGHERCKYTITEPQLVKIIARKMKVEEKHGVKHPIRAKKPSQARGPKSRLNIVRPTSGKRSHHKTVETVVGKTDDGKSCHGDALALQQHNDAPLDGSSRSPLTIGQDALCPIVKKPLDQSSIPVVESVVPSFVGNSSLLGKTPEKTFASLQGKKENREPQENITPAGRKKPAKGSAPRAKRPAPRAAFKPEVEEQFRMWGAPDLWFEAMAPLTETIDILNGETLCGCPYPLQSWATIAKNNPRLKAAQLWTPIFKSGQLEYGSGSSLADQIMSRRLEAEKTPEEREKRAAQYWWGSLELKKMNELIPDEMWIEVGGGKMAPASAILAAYREHAPKRKPSPVPAKKVPESELVYSNPIDPDI